MAEVEQIYLPMSRLLNLHVAAAQDLHAVTADSSAAGTAGCPTSWASPARWPWARAPPPACCARCLARWPDHPRVDLITTDGFLLPNAELERRGLMNRKGFPESFDTARLLNFLHEVKSGRERVEAPVYSHFHYDIIPSQTMVVDRPDILIVEGLNVLQPARMPKDGEAIPFVSDFFNFSIYMDADAKVIEEWYVTRFMRLRQTAFHDPAAYFHRYAGLSDEAAPRPSDLAQHQREEPAGEHPAHAPARPPDPAQGRQSPHRKRLAPPHLSLADCPAGCAGVEFSWICRPLGSIAWPAELV